MWCPGANGDVEMDVRGHKDGQDNNIMNIEESAILRRSLMWCKWGC